MEPRGKTCAVCNQKVHRGTGTYYAGRLIHKACMEITKIQRFKLHKRHPQGRVGKTVTARGHYRTLPKPREGGSEK